MTDLATIRIPVDSSDMVQAVRESKNLERGIKMLVEAFDSGAIGASQFTKGLSQLANDFKKIFTSSEQASNSVEGFANSLMQSKAAADAATASKQALTLATQKAETAFALANQKAKEELQLSRARADFALAMGLQREREAEQAVAAANKQAQAEKRLAQEILKRRNAQEQAATQKAQNFQSQIGSNLGLGAQGISASGSASVFEAQVENLRVKYDRLYAASNLYEKQVRELTQAEALGVISKQRFNKELDQLDMELRQFQTSAEGAILANNRFSQHINQSGRGLNNFGMYAQQVGYQVGDFFVQIQSGTNFLVAFGQQATQLAGLIPGVLGAALGIGISLATAIGAAFMRSATEVEGSANRQVAALKNLSEAIDSTKQSLDEYRFGGSATAFAENEIKNLESQISGINNLIQSLTANIENAKTSSDIDAALIARDLAETEIQTQQEVKKGLEDKLEVLKGLEEAQRMLNGGLSTAAGIQKGIVYNTEVQLRLNRELKDLQENIAGGVVEPQKNLNIQKEYQRLLQAGVKPVEAQAEAQYKVERALIQSKIASGQLTNEQKNAEKAALVILDTTYAFESQIRAAAAETSLLEEGLSQSAIDALKFAGVDLSSGVSAAAAEAAILAANMNMTLSDAYSFINLVNSQVYGQVGARSNPKDFLPGGSKYTNENFKPFVPPDDKKKGGGGDKKDVLADLQKQLELERELVGTSEAYQKVRQALGDEFRKTSPEVIAGLVQQATEIERLIELEQQRKSIMDTVKSSLEDGFMSMVDGTKSVKDAFKSMAAEIIKELYRVYVVKQIVNGISGGIGNFFGGGAVTSSPRPMANPFPRAIGGPVIANQPYIVGERGPELIIPRSSGTVLNNDKTKAAIGGSNDVTVNNNISVTGSDAAMVRAEVAKMIPQITNATKAAVIDAKQRGGQMSAAFR